MVYFVGAGPGDPELITVKGQRLLKQADVVVYAGSLVNPALLQHTKTGCQVHNSAGMNLEQVLEVLVAAHRQGLVAVRLHTGDPGLFGAIREQMDALRQQEVPFENVAGVSSFLAAGAALQMEFTLPEVSQTVILTRMEGRTPVPAGEELASLAAHGATMVLFLSVGMVEEAAEKLLLHYAPTTPAAVVYKASWPEQRIVRATLSTLAEQVKAAGITKTALIVVGWCMGDDYALSKLYDKHFTHEFRKGEPQ